MHTIAIIQFPGLNTEYETRREINRAGMKGEFFRWNDSLAKLKKYDAYVIGGGFSYEDRGRAGIVAALDPVMKVIREEAAKGKPVLGICNGAQILVESGLIPGAEGNKLVMALARNRRLKDGEVLGTGYYNAWITLKHTAAKNACVFTRNFEEGTTFRSPVAHAEGRFTTNHTALMNELAEKGQIVLRYCDAYGAMNENFPSNPNGAMFNAAAICNPAGNVMAVMPHLERDLEASHKLFTSLRDSLAEKQAAKRRSHRLKIQPLPMWPLPAFQALENSFSLALRLIITDNEADTHEMALASMGFEKVLLSRETFFELAYAGKPELQKLTKRLIQSGALLNTNKEWCVASFPKSSLKRLLPGTAKQEQFVYDAKREKFTPLETAAETSGITFRFLVREKPDFLGLSKLQTLNRRLKFSEITDLQTGTLWTLRIETKSKRVAEETFKKIVETHLFFNPHRQEIALIS